MVIRYSYLYKSHLSNPYFEHGTSFQQPSDFTPYSIFKQHMVVIGLFLDKKAVNHFLLCLNISTIFSTIPSRILVDVLEDFVSEE